MLGQKLAIVTPKLQTTRCKIKGIATFEDVQTIFLDTPGIFEGDTRLSRAMVKSAWAAMRDADVTGVVLDVAEMYHVAKRSQREGLWVAGARDVMEKVGGRCEGGGVCVLANKMDCVEEEERGYVMERLRSYMGRCGMGEETRLFGISAVTGEGVEGFVDWVKEGMPRGVWLYAEDDVTDMPMRQIAEEVTRECAFMAVREELPYEIAVETRSYKVLKDGSVRIEQDLLVVRESQKRIVTGRGGQVVKTIGEKARKELKRAWGGEVHLMLTVRVRPGWKEERGMYERWGLDYNA